MKRLQFLASFVILFNICYGSSHLYFLLQNNPDKVKISVFYESYCPYSQKFIQEQLQPTHNLLSDYIELDLVPYGKATQRQTNGSWYFTCQHGEQECYGNKVQACANSKMNENGQNKTLDFISCGFNTNYTDVQIEECADNFDINWSSLKRCYNSTEGDEILAAYGDRTHSTKPPVKFVPMVFFDDVFDRKVDDHAMDELLDVCCRILAKREKPQACVEHDQLFLERVLNNL